MHTESVPDWLVIAAIIATFAILMTKWVKNELRNEKNDDN